MYGLIIQFYSKSSLCCFALEYNVGYKVSLLCFPHSQICITQQD